MIQAAINGQEVVALAGSGEETIYTANERNTRIVKIYLNNPTGGTITAVVKARLGGTDFPQYEDSLETKTRAEVLINEDCIILQSGDSIKVQGSAGLIVRVEAIEKVNR
jgi:hypothetical protein